jgi:two-component system, sensor histidine kinase and response regulator
MRRILLVDDNTIFVNSLAETLRVYRKDALVETASSAEEALVLFAVTRYDAIISDFRLSGMDGFAFLEKCKVLQPNTPVIRITGYGDVEMETQAARRGAYAFLHKPIDPDVLTSVVARATLTANLSRRPTADPFVEKSEEILRKIRQNAEHLETKFRHWMQSQPN